MPRINYDTIPYKRQWSTGERVVSNSFYNPNPDYSESDETYKGYYAYDLFGLKIEELSRKKYTPNHNRADDPFLLSEDISTFNPRYFPDRPGRKIRRTLSYEERRELIDSLRA